MTERAGWTITYEGDKFERFLLSLPEYEQAVLVAAIESVLKVYGVNICEGEWGRPLGDGLYEFRVKKSLGALLDTAGVDVLRRPGDDQKVLLRVFCAFHGNKIVLLYHGYDKKRDPSKKRQQREINKARKLHKAWKARAHSR
jgi:putative component of toxin-antitoxin plasmid stabilization module